MKTIFYLLLLVGTCLPTMLPAQNVFCVCDLFGAPFCGTTNRTSEQFASEFGNSCTRFCNEFEGVTSFPLFPGSADIGYTDGLCTMERSALPVELTAFDVQLRGRAVVLNWQTASEQNNDGFYVERSTDGVTFEEIAFVAGYGTTTEAQYYNYGDLDLPIGYVYYYRLRQVDFDGQSTNSSIIVLTVAGSDLNVSDVYPNPAGQGFARLDIASVGRAEQLIVITDLTGRVVQQLNTELTGGLNAVTLDVSSLIPGAYVVRVGTSGEVIQRKLIVR